jgi:hypothetical protein
MEIPLANPKMSDKLQFVVAFDRGRVAETSDKLKFVGHFHRILALLSNSPAVSMGLQIQDQPRQAGACLESAFI